MKRAWLEWALLALLCVLAVGPATLLDGDAVVGFDTRDLWDHVALLDHWSLRAPEWTFPMEGALVPPDLGGMLLAAPFSPLGKGTAYDMATLLQLMLACGTAWLLGSRYGGGFSAAAVFGLSPYLVNQAFTGEAETLSVWPLPLTLWLLLEDRRVAAGLVAALGAVLSWYHGAFLALLLGGWAVWRRDWRQLLPLAVYAAAVALPAWGYARVLQDPDQLFRGPTMATYLDRAPQQLAWMSADPTDWLGLRGPQAHHHVNALGWVGLLLAALGLRGGRDRGLWMGVLGLGLVLSLGPILFVNGHRVLGWTPYRALSLLPGFGLMRLPHRFMAVAALGLAGLAAQSRTSRVLPLLAAGETLLFYTPLGTATDISAPPVIAEVRGPVLEFPLRTLGHDARGRALVWQGEHQQPTAASLLMQAWSPQVASEPLVVAVCAADAADPLSERPLQARQFRQLDLAQAVAEARRGAPPDIQGAPERLRELGFEEVILHRQWLLAFDQEQVEALLIEALGEPDWRDEEAWLWRL